MLVSYVLRLVASEAAQGRLVGEVEDVQSGEIRVIRGAGELAAVVRASQRAGVGITFPEASPWRDRPDPTSD
ncbi:hypothetical protein [Nocardioides terrisoli]|uniref:hypothetical protein n=1 Tax=Nocardioides terrisoli TaxID=3388267 RepID=UPI00287BB8BD|nr:hypothetical protein [Nocardioides marmorisolisilvae]